MPENNEKVVLEKKVMQLRQKLQILEWDANRDQINPAKRAQIDKIRKEFEEVKKQLADFEAKEKPEAEKEEPEDKEMPQAETFLEKFKSAVEKVEEKLHLKKAAVEDEEFFKDEVEDSLEDIPEEDVPEAPEEAEEEKK